MVDKNPQKIQQMFNKIASKYDLINDTISFFTHRAVKVYAIKALKIQPCSRILDLCCGSGDLGRIVKKICPNCEVIGVDFSSKMLDIAKSKTKEITYLEQDATQLEFESNSFDYVVMGFGLRNIENRKASLLEIYRVLKDEGKFLQLDFGEKNLVNKIYDVITRLIMRNLGIDKECTGYLIDSKNEFPLPSLLVKEFEEIGFNVIELKKKLFSMISYQIMKKV